MDTAEIKQKRAAILEDTAKHFNLNNRSTDGLVCLYFKDENTGCAIGRLIENKEICKKLDEKAGSYGSGVSNDNVFRMLPQHLISLGQPFLISLQKLHDDASYWVENGLTGGGKEQYSKIFVEFCS